MATFADDEDIDFEELWGSGGGGVDVNGTLVTVEGRQADTTTEFGDEVWPGAAALAQSLAPGGVFAGAVRGKRVLELGAGGGLPGLVCAAAGAASVVLSDLPEALPRLRRGVRQNNLANVVVKALDWRSGVCHPLFADYGVEGRVVAYLGDGLPSVSRSWDAKRWLDAKPFDVVICCDGVYRESLAAPLLTTLKRCCTPSHTIFYVANDERSHRQRRFAAALHACHFNVREVALSREACDAGVVCFRGGALEGDVDVRKPRTLFTWYEPRLDLVQDSAHGADGGFVSVGCVVLADWLSATFALKECRVFELGSGTGFVGLICGARGAKHVTLTDDRVALSAWNAARHAHLNATVRRVRWGHADDVDAGDLGRAARLSQDIELIVSAEATQRLDLLDDLAGEVKRRLLSALSFGRGARACLACAPCTKPKFRAKKGWCAEISCARCRVLEECQRVGVVLVEESVAGFCSKDDRRFSGLVDTGFVADYNEALRVLVLRLAEDERAVAMAPPVVKEAAAPAARASRGEAATWATAAQLDALRV
jgi:predicted nicotinamide N-methyase